MGKAEKFIQDCTRDCSNELIAVESRAGKEVISYNEWLTPDQALKAVEIAREEMIEKLRNWVASKNERDWFTFGYIDRHFDELLKQAMEND